MRIRIGDEIHGIKQTYNKKIDGNFIVKYIFDEGVIMITPDADGIAVVTKEGKWHITASNRLKKATST